MLPESDSRPPAEAEDPAAISVSADVNEAKDDELEPAGPEADAEAAPDPSDVSGEDPAEVEDELLPAQLSRPEKSGLFTALLFTATETLDSAKAAEFLGLSEEELTVLAEETGGELRNLGLDILPVANGYKLVTASHYDRHLSLFHRQLRKARLSKSALEILAVIAYEQPISRVRVDELRQASSESAIRTLLDRRLIKVYGREDGPGRPFLYKTTEGFLEVFGLASLKDLPPRPLSFKAEAEQQELDLQQQEGTGDLHVRGEVDE